MCTEIRLYYSFRGLRAKLRLTIVYKCMLLACQRVYLIFMASYAEARGNECKFEKLDCRRVLQSIPRDFINIKSMKLKRSLIFSSLYSILTVK